MFNSKITLFSPEHRKKQQTNGSTAKKISAQTKKVLDTGKRKWYNAEKGQKQ
jgi:hypothetical protein